MVEQASAIGDDKARRRLAASCEHETTVMALGVVPEGVEDSARELVDKLAVIDAEPGPSPEAAAEATREAARRLAGQAHVMGWDPDAKLWRALLQWVGWRLAGRRHREGSKAEQSGTSRSRHGPSPSAADPHPHGGGVQGPADQPAAQ
ncbi:hypothetical protein Nocox_13860 [Nonomuraea coxensis DSM 45129]|uniref:DUF222 domain-containing protein n=1 Tax=Nonomuraea coxensis DSM 45129 TaxID=1122611 RepID=A0ABX8TYM6_9ACTN|nr:hypothetical protein [Nonomuraea coxensis]QYC40388.1 hypothetical protein Nocox_13860 [Nonomuraea coxensis DSM 45129]